MLIKLLSFLTNQNEKEDHYRRSLVDNRIGDAGTAAHSEALKGNATLTSLV